MDKQHKYISNTSIEEPGAAFRGYPSPTSNTLYVPNQFFDVVLRRSSRGCVRLVSYMLRRTLGWCDENGDALEPQVTFSYSELISKAKISRGAICSAIKEAIESSFIRCIQNARPSSFGDPGVSALYELVWDDCSNYTTDLANFNGFFAGEGNRTYIPNAFFDYTIPNESLAVVKVVGAIIRHTIGFQTKLGFRRTQVRLSFSDLQRITHIRSRSTISEALREAQAKGHILTLEPGFFDADAGKSSITTLYGIRWQNPSSKTGPGKTRPSPGPENEPVQKVDRSTSSKTGPEAVQNSNRKQSKKWTGIEITNLNNTSKQQQKVFTHATTLLNMKTCKHVNAAAEGVFEKLTNEGFDKSTAWYLASKYEPKAIDSQIDALPLRNPSKNKLGMLRRSIEENWPIPENTVAFSTSLAAIFVTHVYAAWAGNLTSPVASPSVADINAATTFLAAFPKLNSQETVILLAKRFGEFIKTQENATQPIKRSFVLAVRVFGDRFCQKIYNLKTKKKENIVSKHDQFSSKEELTPHQIELLRKKKEDLQRNSPALWQKFLDEEAAHQKRLETFSAISKELRKQVLMQFDTEESRLKRLEEFYNSSNQASKEVFCR